MNIKDHIEAGHYPKDEKGRALVPMANGDTATILATDLSRGEPIVGWDGDTVESWGADGSYGEAAAGSILRLLPPPPRKVKVTASIEVGVFPGCMVIRRLTAENGASLPKEAMIELAGEVEVPFE